MKKYNNYIKENWKQKSINNHNNNFRKTKTYNLEYMDIRKLSKIYNGDELEFYIRNINLSESDSYSLLIKIIREFKNLDSEHTLISYPTVQLLIDKIKNDVFRTSFSLIKCGIYNRPKIAQMLIDVGADVNFKYVGNPVIFSTLNHESLDVLEVLLDTNNIETNIIFDDDTLLTLAVKKFIFISDFEILLDEDIDWNYISTNEIGIKKTFIEMLDEHEVEIIRQKYPKKYNEYLIKKDLDKFNI